MVVKASQRRIACSSLHWLREFESYLGDARGSGEEIKVSKCDSYDLVGTQVPIAAGEG